MADHFAYEQKPNARFDGIPLFFARRWGGNPQEPFARDGIVFISMEPAVPITIYGYSVTSPYPEDRDSERFAWTERRSFLAWCYSTMEPSGEVGFVPADDVTEISREEFEAAAAASWR